MVFTSITFAFFLPVLFILYWAIPKKTRWIVLLAANIIFYMYGGALFILLMLAIALVTWWCARRILGDRRSGDAGLLQIRGFRHRDSVLDMWAFFLKLQPGRPETGAASGDLIL